MEETLDHAQRQHPYEHAFDVLPYKSLRDLRPLEHHDLDVRITQNDCMEDAMLAARDGEKVLLVDSASLKRPGGGCLGGSSAQEEDLCRRSNLYLGLKQLDDSLRFPLHEKVRGVLFPSVTFFRAGRDEDYGFCDPYVVDVACVYSRPESWVSKQKWAGDGSPSYLFHLGVFEPLISMANRSGADHVVMAPVGCGVFHHDPEDVARALHTVLGEFQLDTVKKVTISTFTSNPDNQVLKAFEWVFRE